MMTNMNYEANKRSHYNYNEIEERFERKNRKKNKQEIKRKAQKRKCNDRSDDWE